MRSLLSLSELKILMEILERILGKINLLSELWRDDAVVVWSTVNEKPILENWSSTQWWYNQQAHSKILAVRFSRRSYLSDIWFSFSVLKYFPRLRFCQENSQNDKDERQNRKEFHGRKMMRKRVSLQWHQVSLAGPGIHIEVFFNSLYSL